MHYNALQYLMRIAKTVCVTVPPDLLKKAQRVAAREHRTMSELVREALRRYMTEEKPEKREAAPKEAETNVLHSFRMTTQAK
jgi:metal-responsive CopG/Arc/MetJ family transcriptional regulator